MPMPRPDGWAPRERGKPRRPGPENLIDRAIRVFAGVRKVSARVWSALCPLCGDRSVRFGLSEAGQLGMDTVCDCDFNAVNDWFRAACAARWPAKPRPHAGASEVSEVSEVST